MLLKWKAACSAIPHAPLENQTNPERFLKAIGQGLGHTSVLNLFHFKEAADQETALHKRGECSAISAIHTGMQVQAMFYTIREH